MSKPIEDAVMTVDMPGAFDRFVSGTGAAQGEAGETPFYVAYRGARRITRGSGYALRLSFPECDADKVLSDLLWCARDCVEANADQMHEASAKSEVAAARKVARHCEDALAELESPRVNTATSAIKAEHLPPKWCAEPHADGFAVTNGSAYSTAHDGRVHTYGTRQDAEWFANRTTASERDAQTRLRRWVTVLDGMEIRWVSSPSIVYSKTSVSPEYRAVVSILELESRQPARLIDTDDVEEPGRVVPLPGKPLGYTKFGRYTHLNFKRFAERFPEYAHVVQGIDNGCGVTRAAQINPDGNDTEGLWK